MIRGQYSLGPSNYVGSLLVDTEFAGGYNRVIGADTSWRVTVDAALHWLSARVGHTRTRIKRIRRQALARRPATNTARAV